MKAFATLYSRLDATTSSNAKLAAMNPGNPKKPQDAKGTLFSTGVFGTAAKK